LFDGGLHAWGKYKVIVGREQEKKEKRERHTKGFEKKHSSKNRTTVTPL
jgi:hypothetical protein